MKKTIDTLVEDIYAVFTEKHEVNEDNLTVLGEAVKDAVRNAVQRASERRVPTLRMSVIGKPDRQLWYELKAATAEEVVETEEVNLYEPNPSKFIKFLYGDILEQLVVFLCREAGHTVTHQQEEVDINGVLGHTDGAIDGVVADVKTASGYSFGTKFKSGGLLSRDPAADPFGYKGQLAGYHEVLAKKYPNDIEQDRVAWVALNKETGELALLVTDVMNIPNAEDRVKQLKEVLSSDTPPVDKCFPDEEMGKSGNRVIHKMCEYCPFKHDCWADANGGQGLRSFRYSNGVKHFTEIVSEPSVPEVIL